jgi:hypothetical protein
MKTSQRSVGPGKSRGRLKQVALISLSAGFTAPKRRPRAYKARDAAYVTGGNNGYYIASLPRPYPRTSQQQKVARVADECGIEKGISKAKLQEAMVSCVGPKMRK